MLISMDKDGIKFGFDLLLIKVVIEVVNIFVIVSGGVGSVEDFVLVVFEVGVNVVFVVLIFYFGEVILEEVCVVLI